MGPMRRFMFVADDFGLSDEANEGLCYAYRAGVLKFASLMVDAPASGAAVRIARECPDLTVGLHLVVDHLLDIEPAVWSGKRHEGLTELIDDPALRDTIGAECGRQAREFLSLGFGATFLNSHFHVHTIPSVFGLFVDVAKEYGFRFMRFSANTKLLSHPDIPITKGDLSRMAQVLKEAGIGHADWFRPTFCYLLPPPLCEGVTEIFFHPAVGDGEVGYLDLARLMIWGDILRDGGCREVLPWGRHGMA
jgi:predicted glycoside hydrolase/deacetylase ChbG (UPF0249 family)